MLRNEVVAVLFSLVSFLCLHESASAQADPRQVLGAVIQQLQTGAINPTWYGPQLLQTIAMQTGGAGKYPQLAQLGPVSQISVVQQIPLPTGFLYSLQATHQNGMSAWVLGIGAMTNRIEYANFNVGMAQPLPSPTPNPNPTPNPSPTPNPNPSDPRSSPACQQFPNLC
ncbi:hypothetical protein [Burkholderia seminalis]|uniref:hypothetical protein n=1 Tax=Burkholderia seminalis TaxID=488731 RepID=UPI0015889502|nr:hypothetical protein [Burkholderia seminalis]